MGRGSRGSTGTLRRLGPKALRRRLPTQFCHVLQRGLYLRTVHPGGVCEWTADSQQALRLSAEAGRAVVLELIERGESAEAVKTL